MTFRNHLPREAILSSVRPLVELLRSPSLVVHSYAANALDKIFILKTTATENGGTVTPPAALVKAEDLAGLEQPLLVNLFGAMSMPGSEENEYVMKAIMRSFSTLQVRISASDFA
jgi:exportin-2 (importin alpha re-exporter)